MKKILLLAVLSSSLFAEQMEYVKECGIEYGLMLTIATLERHPDKPVGYPYLISLNIVDDQQKARENGITGWLDKRTIDCKNNSNCQDLYSRLYSLGIKNVDLGAYQINPIWHKHPKASYFNLGESYGIACGYLKSLEASMGWSWKTIASYHSQTPDKNMAYQTNLKKIYKRYANHE